MIKYPIILAILLASISFKKIDKMDESLTLNIPEKGFEIVQHVPKNKEGRGQNALYLPPRTIIKEEFNSTKLNSFIDSMYVLMVKYSGVGIAANQLGKRLQIFIIEAKADNPRYRVLGPVQKQIFINPIITKVSPKRKNFWHGCLSARDEKRGNVATYEWIEYQCQSQTGEIQTGRLEGFAAVIFQHEFRHLMNGTYLDVAKQFLPKKELDQKIKSGELPFFEFASDTLPLLINGYTIGKTLDEYNAH
jgi:peptide deformylase